MATQSLQADILARPSSERRGVFAYRMLLLFSILYFARPEDILPGLRFIPVAKITGGLALLALIFGAGSRFSVKKFPTELRVVICLFLWECLSVPFAWWKGGALNTVLSMSSKTVIVAMLISLVVNRVDRLRQLIYVQAAAVAAMTFAAVVVYRGGRLGGVLGGVFDNPNDLAINISMSWPLCLMFLLRTRNPIYKLLWGAGLVVLIRGLMLTYSRTGFLALGMAIFFCLVEFGFRGKRYYLIGVAFFAMLVAVFAAPTGYGQRVGSIFGKPLDVGDSQEARRELLNKSLQVTAAHPLLGIGPGNFQAYTETWHVTHNTYTELSSECGVPALILFLVLLGLTFRNLKRVRQTQNYAQNPEIRLLAAGLGASLSAYAVGAFFASTAYQLFPYFLMSYTTVLLTVASSANVEQGKALSPTWAPNPQLVR